MKNLAELRKAKGLTQKELAENLGLGTSTIAMYESGVVGMWASRRLVQGRNFRPSYPQPRRIFAG